MLEPKKPGEEDPGNPGGQSGTSQAPNQDQKPGVGQQAPDQAGLPRKDTPTSD